jgi:dihydroneopterin aldolase
MSPPYAHYELNSLVREIEIGCANEEHGIRQPVTISMRVALVGDTLFGGETKHPKYDYCDLLKAVDDAISSRPRFILQETLLVAIACRVLANRLVERLEIVIAKTQRYEGCESIGVRASLTHADVLRIAERYPQERDLLTAEASR